MNKYITSYLTVSLIFLLGFSACVKDVNIQPKSDYEGQLFIECILYPGELPRVYVSGSSPFFHEKVSPQEIFVRGAEVMLSDDYQTELLSADSTFDKFRCRWVPFYGGTLLPTSGKTYELQVTYQG
ncbi:MAG: DUF4249 family protein, partial [Sinomicrobium sp.]|nr:DUF4249 family protein [Sinomicrobium sp.]